MKSGKINYVLIASLALGFISGCNSGSNNSSTIPPQSQSVSVPLMVYSSGNQTKYYAYTSVGGGAPGMTVVDTGSDVYFVARNMVGPNVKYTNESVVLYYDFGNRSVTGVLAYAPVTLYSGNNPVVSSSMSTPIVVTESASAPFIGLMGVGMRGNLSPQLFFPSPYNQAMAVNLPESTLSFGLFNSITNTGEASYVQLESQVCNNYGTSLESSSANCWNTFAVPVKSSFSNGNGTYTDSTMSGVLDTGSDSGYQLQPFPNYISVNNSYVSNFAYATINTSSGPLQVYMTPTIYAATSSYNGGNFVNVGNNIFNYYQIVFDRYDGKVWFKAPL
jgi:hypothetical protein